MNPSIPGVVHGSVVVDGVVDGDVALEGDGHSQEDGAGQRDAVQRVQKLREGERDWDVLIHSVWFIKDTVNYRLVPILGSISYFPMMSLINHTACSIR